MLVTTSPHMTLVPLMIFTVVVRFAVSVNMVSFTNVAISSGNPAFLLAHGPLMSFGMSKVYSAMSLASHFTAARDGSLCVHVSDDSISGIGIDLTKTLPLSFSWDNFR